MRALISLILLMWLTYRWSGLPHSAQTRPVWDASRVCTAWRCWLGCLNTLVVPGMEGVHEGSGGFSLNIDHLVQGWWWCQWVHCPARRFYSRLAIGPAWCRRRWTWCPCGTASWHQGSWRRCAGYLRSLGQQICPPTCWGCVFTCRRGSQLYRSVAGSEWSGKKLEWCLISSVFP